MVHRFELGKGFDLGDLGVVGASAWLELFNCDTTEAGTDGGSLQQVDYTLYWSRSIEGLGLTVELGWIAETYPQRHGDAFFTNEFYGLLRFDDRRLFGTDAPVLNPYAVLYWDTDDLMAGRSEWGVSHDFTPAELGTQDVPLLRDLTLTPAVFVCVDHGQLGGGTRVSDWSYGFNLSYDLRRALDLPKGWGNASLNFFLYYRDAIADDVLNDQFYGGVSIGWSF